MSAEALREGWKLVERVGLILIHLSSGYQRYKYCQFEHNTDTDRWAGGEFKNGQQEACLDFLVN